MPTDGQPRTKERRVASHPDDPSAPFADRLLLALGMWPSYVEEIGADEVVEAAVIIRTKAHQFPMVAEDYGALATENEQLRAGVNGTDWENDLLANAPDHYDDDVAQTAIITEYVHDLEAVRDAAVTVMERLGCLHAFDPECGRCEWMLPFRCAMDRVLGRPADGIDRNDLGDGGEDADG